MKFPHVCSTLIASLVFVGTASAADFPSRSITVNNAWVPGGIVEMSYRPCGDELARLLNTNVVLNPASGAGGLMGVNKTLQGKKDGYNLLLTSDMSILGLSQLRKVRWNYDDFIPIGSYGTTSYGLVIKKGETRFTNLDEFIAYAKAHPGELSCGQSGMLGTEHIGSAMMKTALGIDYKFVPFDGALAAVAAVGSGHIDCAFTPMLYYDTITPIAGCGEERFKDYPDVPTFKEKGYNFTFDSSYGLFARKGTPEAQIKILRDAMLKAVNSEANLNNLPRVRMNPIFYIGEDWENLMKSRIENIHYLIKEGIIVPEEGK